MTSSHGRQTTANAEQRRHDRPVSVDINVEGNGDNTVDG